jgi:hypothetical protein
MPFESKTLNVTMEVPEPTGIICGTADMYDILLVVAAFTVIDTVPVTGLDMVPAFA